MILFWALFSTYLPFNIVGKAENSTFSMLGVGFAPGHNKAQIWCCLLFLMPSHFVLNVAAFQLKGPWIFTKSCAQHYNFHLSSGVVIYSGTRKYKDHLYVTHENIYNFSGIQNSIFLYFSCGPRMCYQSSP